jgi:hypothetical protein
MIRAIPTIRQAPAAARRLGGKAQRVVKKSAPVILAMSAAVDTQHALAKTRVDPVITEILSLHRKCLVVSELLKGACAVEVVVILLPFRFGCY